MPLFTIIIRATDRLFLVESMDTDEDAKMLENFRKKGKQIFYKMTPASEPLGILVEGGYYFMYCLEGDLCYMTFCEKSYPRKLALKFLEEIKKEFELQYGSDLKTKRLTPYAFQKFDKFIQQTKKLYKDSNSMRNLNVVSSDLKDIDKILQKNVSDILERGVRLEKIQDMSEELVHKSKTFENQTKKLVWNQWVRKMGFVAFICLFVMFVGLFLYWYNV
uniref:V-SNARE coiled-coil homology domain-containing protein n=1 Tax=Arcella intermedia TaxID=1963864 RepID=A0A6B2LHN0_9EUKA